MIDGLLSYSKRTVNTSSILKTSSWYQTRPSRLIVSSAVSVQVQYRSMLLAGPFRYAVDNSVDATGRVTTELRIVQASHMDRGDYVCVAANAYGHAKATIHLLVQEPPDFPRNLHVAEQGSRSILLAWSSPTVDRDASHASSPITNYIVQYKEAQGTPFFFFFLFLLPLSAVSFWRTCGDVRRGPSIESRMPYTLL